MITKSPSSDPNKVRVRFDLPSSIWADHINLVGEFNDWNRTSHPLARDRDGGNWYIVVELEKGKEYQFRYLANDSDWHNDWKADKYVPNIHGGTNSVVVT